MEAGGGSDEVFEVSSEPETVVPEPQFEGANVCRAAALSTMLGGDRGAVAAVSGPLSELGFADRLSSGETAGIDIDPLESFGDVSRGRDGDLAVSRIGQWQRLNEQGDPRTAVAFLVSVLGSPLERESAAAAVALSRQLAAIDPRRLWRPGRWRGWLFLLEELEVDLRELPWPRFPSINPGDIGPVESFEGATRVEWDADRWVSLYERTMSRRGDRYAGAVLVALLVRQRLDQALRSYDPTTRSLAAAIFPPSGREEPGGTGSAGPSAPPSGTVYSTMIHGTWGWRGDWWRPHPGSFHGFILENHRNNLYAKGARFSWSGAYRRGDREQAALDFCDWAAEVAQGGIQTVFAHSYGGEVATRAVTQGAPVKELVLLSVPVTHQIEAAVQSGLRVVDVRLAFDPVLGLARKPQRLKAQPNVTPVVLNRWRLDHSASHQADVWRTEEVANRGGV